MGNCLIGLYLSLQVNRFEQLCINMCSEVLEHIYTTHLFRNPLDCQREEAIETGIDFIDNTAVVEILSAKVRKD
jgi:dachs protein